MFVTTPDDLTLLTAWGKWDETSGQIHPWACHSLDVMAAGAAYLDANPCVVSRAWEVLNEADPSGETRPPFSREKVRKLLLWFLALHDIGKVSPWFQGKKYTNLPTGLPLGEVYHSSLGWGVLSHLEDVLLPLGYSPYVHEGWFRAIFGHHGYVATKPTEDFFNQQALRPDVYIGLVRQFVLYLTTLLDETEPGESIRNNLFPAGTNEYPKIEPILAGLTILSDWVGSNYDHVDFGFYGDKIATQSDLLYGDLKTYYETRTGPIRQSVEGFGLRSIQLHPDFKGSFRDLFGWEPRTLQKQIETIPLEGGRVFLIEDQTGSGKTEAALLLACRLINQGGADRVHFLLPSGATTNAMHGRIRDFLKKTFAFSETLPSLSIAHSAHKVGVEDFDYGGAGWIQNNRKKVYLANFAVSTVDQALFAILPQRHNILRFFGLLQGVVVFDEIHSYDAYTLSLIADLIRQLRRMGGRVILLSATLPREVKEYLYRQIHPNEPPPQFSSAYPLVTVLRDDPKLLPIEIPTDPHHEREVRIEPIASHHDAIKLFSPPGARLWVRNTVREAIETYLDLKRVYPESDPILFHGRFTLWDRKRLENEVLRLFGKDSSEERNRILVATQVVEQSLDLDFDLIVSDLCPIDMLLQRLGRLHRHDRTGRWSPTLYVRTPQWNEGRIADPELAGTPKVYRDEGLLALTEEQIRSHPVWKIPHMVRSLLDGVYRDDPKTASYRARRSRKGHLASQGADDHSMGWRTTKTKSIPTRDGWQSLEVVLYVGENPLHGTEEDSRIRVRWSDDLPLRGNRINLTQTGPAEWACDPYRYSSELGFHKIP